jgi:endonuclease G
MDGTRVRNFSVCYDTVKMCSRWVAYPGHSVYRKWGSYQVGENNNSGRTNAWAFDDAVTQYAPHTDYNQAYSIVSKYNSKTDAYDTATEPIIPHRRQADICFTNGFGWGWARGHMLPSSQRYNTWENNAQTCYATNIMVQQYDFNGGSWADVEALERNKNCSDTLYVVVGTLFEDSKTITRFGRTIGVPTHCYKLLLRTKSGKTGKAISDVTSADELICIGFLFENSEASKDKSISAATTSVAEIEKRAGFKFFRNLNPAIADKVKSQNKPGDWGL